LRDLDLAQVLPRSGRRRPGVNLRAPRSVHPRGGGRDRFMGFPCGLC